MRCFYHRDRDAVGECKACGKGVCAECAVDLGRGLACRDRCEDEAKALIALIDNNLRMAQKTPALLRTNRHTYVSSGALHIVLGGVFLAWGLLATPRHDVPAVLGGVFVAYGLYTMFRVFGMPRADKVPLGGQEQPDQALPTGVADTGSLRDYGSGGGRGA